MTDLTNDEQYIRNYLLLAPPSRLGGFRAELPYLLPAIVIAILALANESPGAVWLAFMYIVGLYLWRVSNGRWSLAIRSLLAKYEARITELESAKQ